MADLRILVCDDRDDDAVKTAILESAGDVEVDTLNGDGLLDALNDLSQAIRGFLASEARQEEDLPTSRFDGYDVVIVDNNLAELKVPGARLTAEAILGSLRAFASSAYLVSLNKNPLVDFDLRYLVGDYATRADLALNEEHLPRPALWRPDPPAGEFAPWYWPVLSDAASRRRSQIDFVEAKLDQPILAALGVPDEAMRELPARALGFLDPGAMVTETEDGAPLEPTTFWHHFRSSNRTLPLDDRVMVALGGPNDTGEARTRFLQFDKAVEDPAVRRIAARIVAAELDLWVRRDLLGPQQLLVDAPHLQILIGVRPQGEGPDQWQRTATEQEVPFGFDRSFYDSVLAPRRLVRTEWAPRAAFWWPAIEADGALAELRKSGARAPSLAFAEDTRRFVKTTAEPAPWRFVAENGKPWAPRFVEVLPGFDYSPRSSFAH